MKTTAIKLNQLLVDPELIELRTIDTHVVSRYRLAYRAGTEMPPLVVDRKTKMIVSGNHRYMAMLGEFSPEYKAGAILKTFKTRRELLEEFVLENSRHGKQLDGITMKKISFALNDCGASAEDIARLFNRPAKSVEEWFVKSVIVVPAKSENKMTKKTVGKNFVMPYKSGPDMPAEIPEKQYREHIKKDRGVTFYWMADQIIRWEDNGWIAVTPENIDKAKELKKAIIRFLGEAE